MNPNESREAVKLSRKSFGILEGLFITKPKAALVAVIEDKIVGGFFYKVEQFGSRKIGIADFIFIDPAYQGQGIGKQLYDEGLNLLRQQGCDALLSIVRDDNVASWGMFVNDGFIMASLLKISRFLGLRGAAKLFFSLYGHAFAYDCYINFPDKETTNTYKKQSNSAGQILSYLLINLALATLLLFRTDHQASVMLAVLSVFAGTIITGYIGTLFTKRKWRFRLVSGGLLSCVFLSALNFVFGIFVPMIGNWYPNHYENTREFKKDLAINSITVWIFLLILSASTYFINSSIQGYPFLAYTSGIASLLLVLRCIPLLPAGSYGGTRVLEFSKALFVIFVLISALIVIIIPIILGRSVSIV